MKTFQFHPVVEAKNTAHASEELIVANAEVYKRYNLDPKTESTAHVFQKQDIADLSLIYVLGGNL